MAILLSRGPSADFDADRMSSGEVGVATDIHRAWVTTSPGDAWEIANKEDLDATQDALDAEVTAREELETAIEEEIVPEIEKKADADGTYPDLYAGNLTSTRKQTDTVPYLMRKTGGDLSRVGEREDDTLVGATVNVNQLVLNGNFQSTENWDVYSSERSTISAGNNILTQTFSGEPTNSPFLYAVRQTNVFKNATHKHLFICEVTPSFSTNFVIEFGGSAKIRSTVITGNTNWVLCGIGDVATYNNALLIYPNSGTSGVDIAGQTVQYKNAQIIDLTAYFGSTIADYLYSLETATAGAGVAKLKEWGFFTEEYIPYNAGTLESVEARSHVMRGFNQWDEEWELGSIDNNGQNVAYAGNMRSKNYIRVLPNTQYFAIPKLRIVAYWYDGDKKYISMSPASDTAITSPPNAQYMRFRTTDAYGGAYNNDICINLSNPDRNGEYEPYHEYSYDLGTDTLRGLFKLDSNNNLYADGDTKTSDGTVTRRYGITVVTGDSDISAGSSGMPFKVYTSGKKSTAAFTSEPNGICDKLTGVKQSSTWGVPFTFSFAMNQDYMYFKLSDSITTIDDAKTYLASNPITLVYELATPTTEQSTPFTNPQICDPDGTEEYVTNNGIPVGHETEYDYDIKGLAEGLIDVPDVPSSNGTYVLKATRSASGISYEWIEETSTAPTPATTTAEAEAGDTV